MSANNNIQISELDFDSIKTNLKTFLRSQQKFKDYDFEGSGLAILMDLLAYNTHYNSYYLNMVANEMFLDTAALRSSVVSHAKLLNYVPKSTIASSAVINLQATNVNSASVTLPKFSKFLSEAIDGVNYQFITKDTYTVSTISNVATFTDVEIVQGEPITLSFTYDESSNPKQLFTLPDTNIDTTTLLVQVQQSISNTNISTYNLETNISNLTSSSEVYFLQESLSGFYEIYFGDNILGKKLNDGNIVSVSYISTNGTSAMGANNFVFLDSIEGIASVFPVSPATSGGEKESIESIKFQAPKSYSAQGRAVSYQDYITAIQQNKLGFAIDSVSVWGGEDNIPPAYGQVFVSIKPTNAFRLTESQKIRLINEVIRPISVVTVKPTIVDPDITYIKVTTDVVYDQKLTNLTSSQIQQKVKQAIQSFANSTLNTFNSTFSISDLSITIQNSDNSIIASNPEIQLQKKIYPTLGAFKTYNLNYGVPLERSVFQAGITSKPSVKYYNSNPTIVLIDDVYIEEVPFATSGIESISIMNPGFNYTSIPKVTITGDGSGATAHAIIKNGYISKIVVDTPGNNYTQAIVTIENDTGDTSGLNGAAFAVLQGQFGTIRSYYFQNNIKTILNPNIGSIDYFNGIITLNDFAPFDVNDPFGQLTITATPQSSIVSSARNRIISIDPFDSNAITVNVTAK
jgi:hypothetical protein